MPDLRRGGRGHADNASLRCSGPHRGRALLVSAPRRRDPIRPPRPAQEPALQAPRPHRQPRVGDRRRAGEPARHLHRRGFGRNLQDHEWRGEVDPRLRRPGRLLHRGPGHRSQRSQRRVGGHRRAVADPARSRHGRRHLQVGQRGQDLEAHGARSHRPHRARDRRSPRCRRRLRLRGRAGLSAAEGARRLQDHRRRQDLERGPVREREHRLLRALDGRARSEHPLRGHVADRHQDLEEQRRRARRRGVRHARRRPDLGEAGRQRAAGKGRDGRQDRGPGRARQSRARVRAHRAGDARPVPVRRWGQGVEGGEPLARHGRARPLLRALRGRAGQRRPAALHVGVLQRLARRRRDPRHTCGSIPSTRSECSWPATAAAPSASTGRRPGSRPCCPSRRCITSPWTTRFPTGSTATSRTVLPTWDRATTSRERRRASPPAIGAPRAAARTASTFPIPRTTPSPGPAATTASSTARTCAPASRAA